MCHCSNNFVVVAVAAGEDVAVEAVAGLEMTKTAASEVVEALEVHHSVAARQPLQTMKKNGIRTTKELLKRPHQNPLILYTLVTIILILLYCISQP